MSRPMEQDLIALVNKLQDTFNAIGGESVDLPQIVTVGSQSSGKSSVLENIVGRDFLPRGQGIVTRRPLVLQLIHLPPAIPEAQDRQASSSPLIASSSKSLQSQYAITQPSSSTPSNPNHDNPSSTREYAEFLHTHTRFYDFAEVRREIENETKRVTGANKGISKLPIHLKLYSERVLNLTLVDLPGLTKIPVGDQPSDIERQIRALVLEYISKPNSVILAISPANVDLANSDSLKLARTVDPQGRRTIGVLTKLDLMDNGTNALDILTGRVYPLKLGFIGVVNRSQQDINQDKPMLDALASEEDFFRSHPGYRNIAHRCGTKYLAKTLNQVLLSHIRDKLPDMKARLNTLMGQTQQELAAFGDSAFLGEQHRGTLILKLMTQFVRDFVASIDGTSPEISTKELCGGARIYYIFHDVFGNALESINPIHNLTVQDIRTAIRNSTGPRPSLFVPEVAFDLLVKPQIKLLEPPSLRCVELVYEELMKICHNCTSAELQRYPRLHAQLIDVVSELLRERLGPTSEYVQSLISIQAAYINTNHPMFINGTTRFARERAETQQREAANAAAASRRRLTDARREGERDDQSEAEDEVGTNLPSRDNRSNGRVPEHHKSRSMSTTASEKGALHVPTARHPSSGQQGPAPRPISPVGFNTSHSSSSAVAKESFLNYFFGGGAAAVPNGIPQAHHQSRKSAGGLLDFSEPRSDNPLAGRRGLEGNAAAFDMKSLDKHLDASSTHGESNDLSEREEMETSLIQSLISGYFGIVRETIQDLVPKAVMHLLVNFSRESIQNRLVSSLYRESLFADLLYEDESLTAERNRVKQLLDAYKEAFRTLSEVL